MSQRISAALRNLVLSRAGGRCAYYLSEEALLGLIFEVDHIIPLAAGGESIIDNLCLSCPTCNRLKAARQTAPDPLSGEVAPLYHPLLQSWQDHFAWSADTASLVGLTPTGRATIHLAEHEPPRAGADAPLLDCAGAASASLGTDARRPPPRGYGKHPNCSRFYSNP